MITSLADFEKNWANESRATLRLLDAVTDASLKQAVTPEDRTLGRVAWHITTSIHEMMGRTGLSLKGPAPDAPVPPTAAAIRAGYAEVAKSIVEQITSSWTDATLSIEDDMYGEKWKRGTTLMVLMHHEIHHRGQMTVLMRQAGLRVPGVYGPSREEWVNYGMPAPQV